MAKKKKEALSVSRLIKEVLVDQLNIPFRQIVNDTTFSEYTGSKRPDILISEFEYDNENDNSKQYIKNLLAYAEAKDNCNIDDADWKDAIRQGAEKSKKLKLPYFMVTNCKKTIFYNAKNKKELSLNGNPIREFQTIDIFRLIKNKLKKNPDLTDIITEDVDSNYAISEATFNKKLWELKNIYRGISFKNKTQEIDFTIGFIALEYYEEKINSDGKRDNSKIYWSSCKDESDIKLVANLKQYISELEREEEYFNEFRTLIDVVKNLISNGINGEKPIIIKEDVKAIYDIIDEMQPLHDTGFDLFGAVYEMFADAKEKKSFGQYFTRRHYTHIFSKLLLKNELYYNSSNMFNIIDPACGTGGFLTESFKVLKKNYEKTRTLNNESKEFLSKNCFYGVDIKGENILRTKLNMFLVGDGHTNMYDDNSLKPEKSKSKYILNNKEFKYILTNPPYGNGKNKANTDSITSNRYEVAFLCKIIELLCVGGKACVIVPDGLLENPSLEKFRKEVLEKCNIDAIISLPKFAFAPYTKEKTYALFLTKRSKELTRIQEDDIWMYIIDNDGLANSDKRFPTKLRKNNEEWLHDEISGWVSKEGKEMPGILERRWLKFDDKNTNGTEWIDEKGETVLYRKGGFIKIRDIVPNDSETENNIENKKHYTLLPEAYLRKYEPQYLTLEEFEVEYKSIINNLKMIGNIDA